MRTCKHSLELVNVICCGACLKLLCVILCVSYLSKCNHLFGLLPSEMAVPYCPFISFLGNGLLGAL